MKIDEVVDAAQRWAVMRESGLHQDAMKALSDFRAAIEAYGAAQRERCAPNWLLHRMSHMLARYVSEVPLGHQPHMAALEAESLVREAREFLNASVGTGRANQLESAHIGRGGSTPPTRSLLQSAIRALRGDE